jgi:hypothetical protein
MDNEKIFINDTEREKLQIALDLVNNVLSGITDEYEDYSAIKTTVWYLTRAIKCNKEYY